VKTTTNYDELEYVPGSVAEEGDIDPQDLPDYVKRSLYNAKKINGVFDFVADKNDSKKRSKKIHKRK